MQSVKSYEPRDKVAKPKRLCGFLKSKKSPKNPKLKVKENKPLGIKNNPKIIVRAIIYSLTSIALIVVIIISAYNVIRWRAENEATRAQLEEIYSATSFKDLDESEENPEDKRVVDFILNTKKLIPSDDKYWTYIKYPLLEVDLSASIATNADTAGWIQVPGTNIDYPFVQTDNNDYYLTHTINRSWSSAGWVFLDYRNQKTLNDHNQIIYAHGRYDGSMFGSLGAVLSKEWLENEENHVVKISTTENNSLWQVFSVYQIKVTDDYLKINFIDDNRFQEFIDLIKNRSVYDFKTDVTPDNQIITLSTCASGDERIVLHAKLIKKGAR